MLTIREMLEKQILIRKSAFGGLFIIQRDKHKEVDRAYMSVK